MTLNSTNSDHKSSTLESINHQLMTFHRPLFNVVPALKASALCIAIGSASIALVGCDNGEKQESTQAETAQEAEGMNGTEQSSESSNAQSQASEQASADEENNNPNPGLDTQLLEGGSASIPEDTAQANTNSTTAPNINEPNLNTSISANSSTSESEDKSSQSKATPLTNNQHNFVTSDITDFKQGTPEAVLAKALNTLYYGKAEDAVDYYQTDMKDFETQLHNTQPAFQKTVEGISITDIQYNDDKTQATIEGTIKLAGVDQPDSAEYQMRKVNGKWKIIT